VKRADPIRHVLAEGCELLWEGARHSLYVHRTSRGVSAIPRHREINDFLARKICRDLGIDEP
jgi:mRNA interferase HicA